MHAWLVGRVGSFDKKKEVAVRIAGPSEKQNFLCRHSSKRKNNIPDLHFVSPISFLCLCSYYVQAKRVRFPERRVFSRIKARPLPQTLAFQCRFTWGLTSVCDEEDTEGESHGPADLSNHVVSGVVGYGNDNSTQQLSLHRELLRFRLLFRRPVCANFHCQTLSHSTPHVTHHNAPTQKELQGEGKEKPPIRASVPNPKGAYPGRPANRDQASPRTKSGGGARRGGGL